MSNVALVVIYNHKYDDNIPIIDSVYQSRFSHVYHAVPFYQGGHDHVIPVQGNSFYFQGYVAQVLSRLAIQGFDHYIFVADDMILNPSINEKNYEQLFKIDANTCFLPGFIVLHERVKWWKRVEEAYHWSPKVKGIELSKSDLPLFDEAIFKFSKHNINFKPLKFHQVWEKPDSIKKLIKKVIRDPLYFYRYLTKGIFKKNYNLPYPLVGSYSDIFIINRKCVDLFAHYCRVFASTELFVELAIPTAMAFSTEQISTESNMDLRGRALWSKTDLESLDAFNNSLSDLLHRFPSNYLYLHPVKLSKWECDL